ncbi:MAG: hypothetical protein HWN81_22885 [Candidatus Lokiarchaeota archaeon]|nr:hypothetical protein [Candidatus Lokiarchaeota archaeon]
MNDEEVIVVLKRIEKEVNINRRVNQDILTSLLTILATLVIFAFLILTSFPDPSIAVILLIVPLLIGMTKIIMRH